MNEIELSWFTGALLWVRIISTPPSLKYGPLFFLLLVLITYQFKGMRYIAAQAPLPSTFSDFWSMIWDQNVQLIVMLVAIQKRKVGSLLLPHPLYVMRNSCSATNIGMMSCLWSLEILLWGSRLKSSYKEKKLSREPLPFYEVKKQEKSLNFITPHGLIMTFPMTCHW